MFAQILKKVCLAASDIGYDPCQQYDPQHPREIEPERYVHRTDCRYCFPLYVVQTCLRCGITYRKS